MDKNVLAEINLFNFVIENRTELQLNEIDNDGYHYRLNAYRDCLVENMLLTNKEVSAIIKSAEKE